MPGTNTVSLEPLEQGKVTCGQESQVPLGLQKWHFEVALRAGEPGASIGLLGRKF